MNKITNRQTICDVLLAHAEADHDIIALCSDSRGSASMTPFAEKYHEQFVEVGIAEQDLVGIAAGLASCGKKPYVFSPASFLSTRSYEQIKIDCAYSEKNVKLVGISGGVSYGALGMSHHSAQDIASITAIPNMRVYLPSDRIQSGCLIESLLKDEKPAYIRIGRNAVEDIYEEKKYNFELNKANILREGKDIAIIACGEMVKYALDAAEILHTKNIESTIVDMYCLKPFDKETLLSVINDKKAVFTVEEHSPFGGLGSLTDQVISEKCPKRVKNLSLPDAPVITGTSQEVFKYYGLDAAGISESVINYLGLI